MSGQKANFFLFLAISGCFKAILKDHTKSTNRGEGGPAFVENSTKSRRLINETDEPEVNRSLVHRIACISFIQNSSFRLIAPRQ